jgi:hypothetical protein
LPLFPDSIISIDRAYIGFKWLNSLDESGIWFVTHAKADIDYVVAGQHPISGKGVRKDQKILLDGPQTKNYYQKEPRLINFYDEETKKHLTFLTNNMKLAASTIAAIYKSRWQIELFFE